MPDVPVALFRKVAMTTVTLEEAANRLSELIHGLSPGEELVITENDQPVARLTGTTPESDADTPRRQSGTLRGTVLYMAEDFDAPLEEFKEYMP
jgi:antitoxin (DNA-binding transcriptional repressor) of toxin-antitoxin stability system